MAQRNGNTSSKVLEFDIVDRDGNEIGTLKVDPAVKMSQPTAAGKGGGKEYIVAEAALNFGENGVFGGRVTLWPPRVAAPEPTKQVVRTLS